MVIVVRVLIVKVVLSIVNFRNDKKLILPFVWALVAWTLLFEFMMRRSNKSYKTKISINVPYAGLKSSYP